MGLGFAELRPSSSTFTAESESLWEKLWARLWQSRDCFTWPQAQTAQPYWVSTTQAELDAHTAAPGIREAVGAVARLGPSVRKPTLEECGRGNAAHL